MEKCLFFKNNCFMLETPNSDYKLGTTKYIIPYKAIKKITPMNDGIEIQLNDYLTQKKYYENNLLEVEDGENIFISFFKKDEDEKNWFLQIVNDYLNSANNDNL